MSIKGNRCAITEQGDLGLGATPVDENAGKKEDKNEEVKVGYCRCEKIDKNEKEGE